MPGNGLCTEELRWSGAGCRRQGEGLGLNNSIRHGPGNESQFVIRQGGETCQGKIRRLPGVEREEKIEEFHLLLIQLEQALPLLGILALPPEDLL